jgi:hypothetical protein
LLATGAPRKDDTRPRGVSRADAPEGRATARSWTAAITQEEREQSARATAGTPGDVTPR